MKLTGHLIILMPLITASFILIRIFDVNPPELNLETQIAIDTNIIDQAQQFFKQGNYQQTIKLNPRHHLAHLKYAQQLTKKENYTKAEFHFKKALHLNPQSFETHMHLARFYRNQHSQKNYIYSMEHIKKALQLKPNNAGALIEFATTLMWQGDYQKALQIFDEIKESTSNWRLPENIGHALSEYNQIEQANEYYNQAIELDSHNPTPHIALANNYFMLGRLQEGHQEYEWRWHRANRTIPNPWTGENPKSKTIFLLSENGLGDIIQYVRFAKLIKKQGARVLLLAPWRLVPLLSLCPYIDNIFESGQQQPHFDHAQSIQTLPLIYKVNQNTIPQEPYIYADQQLVKQWALRLASDCAKALTNNPDNQKKRSFNVGICWAAGGDLGTPKHRKRSIPLQEFAPLAKLNGIKLISLQKSEATKELNEVTFQIIDFGNELDEHHGCFMDTAAIMKNLDLVISVDTSVAHLAGGLGVKTWILLPFHPDPRWLLKRSDSIWYKTVRLFRQKKPGDWHRLMQEVKKQLEHLCQ